MSRKKLANHIYNKEVKEALLGISTLKYYDVQELKEVFLDCESQKIMELVYKNPETKKETLKKIKAKSLVYQNDKIYLYGYDFEKEKSTVLMYKRIKNIISKTVDERKLVSHSFDITYQLKNFETESLSEEENIIEQKDGICLIKGKFYNKFYAMQKVLYYGSKCTVISPAEFREAVISKLKEMKEVYND